MSASRLRKEHRFTVVPEHLVRDKDLSDRAIRLWCLLDRYAGKDDQAFPSRQTLSADLSCSRPSVDRAILELVDNGWLKKARREAGGTNEYTLLIGQVRKGGVITSEDTPQKDPVITDEDRVSSPMTTGVITHDAQKEASLREPSPKEETSEPERPDVDELCEHLAARIEANGSKRPTITKKWRDAARLMLDTDGRTLSDVHGAIEWSQNDEFWRSNILSMPTLRQQYDRLRLAAERRQGHQRSDTAAHLARAAKRLGVGA